ncbi:MAG TPA: PKD domain-containing protein, partial [Polyangiaceae bacterium]
GQDGNGDSVAVRATVRDVLGRPLGDVELAVVGSGTSARTNDDGAATLSLRSGRTVTIKLTREGYADQFEVLTLHAGTRTLSLDAALLEREPPRTIPAVELGGAAAGKHGVRLELPPNAVVDASGEPVSGPIEVSITPVNVMSVEVAAFPGRFQGIDEDDESIPIVSYGTAEFQLSQDGEPVRLAEDIEATIELPIYPSLHPDRTEIRAGDEIPLWSLDETTGIWNQEGTGVVVASPRSPSGLSLRASVAHFSWWNCDSAPETAELRIRCVIDDEDEFAPVDAETSCRIVGTVVEDDLPVGLVDPADTLLVLDELSNPLEIPAEMNVLVAGCATVEREADGERVELCGEELVTLEPESLTDITLELSATSEFALDLVEPSENLTTDGDVEFEVTARGETPPTVVQLIADRFLDPDSVPTVIHTWTSPPYRFTWDTRTHKQGDYTVAARARRGAREAWAEHVAEVTIDRDSPPPEARFAIGIALDQPGSSYTFDPRQSITNTLPLESFLWDFGDGDQAFTTRAETVTHRYFAQGTYPVTLTVMDGDGKFDSVTQELVVAERDSLGAIALERTGPALEERQPVTFRATLPAAMNVTWSVRYAATHPIAALREQCVGASNCGVVVPDGSAFEFVYNPDTTFRHPAARPDAAFDAYDELITITANTLTGFSELTTTIEVPDLAALTIGTSAELPCFYYSDTLRRVDVPDAWFAIEATFSEDADLVFEIIDPESGNAVIPPATRFDNGVPRTTKPMRGLGQPSLASVRCIGSNTELTVTTQRLSSSGTLPFGELTRIQPSNRGDFYVLEGVPADAPLVEGIRTRLTVAAREDSSNGAEVELFAADGSAGTDDGCSVCDFNSSTLLLEPPIEQEFVALFRNDGFASTEVLAAVPAPLRSVAFGETVATNLEIGFVPTLVDLTAPADRWVLVTNDQRATLGLVGSTWPLATPFLVVEDWRAGIATGETQRLRLSLPPLAQFFLPGGLATSVRVGPSLAVITPNSPRTGTVAPSGHDYAHLFEFQASSGSQVGIAATATDVQYVVLAPDGEVLRICSAASCGTSPPDTVPSTGRHAVVVSIDPLAETAVNYDFTLVLTP